MFLRKYIVKCSIDLEHNRVSVRLRKTEFMNPLHNFFNWIFQISHHTQIINRCSSGKLASELLGPFVFNFVVISTQRRLGDLLMLRPRSGGIYTCPQPDCSTKVTSLDCSLKLLLSSEEVGLKHCDSLWKKPLGFLYFYESSKEFMDI